MRCDLIKDLYHTIYVYVQMKNEQLRTIEAISIRQQLQKLGVLMDPESRIRLTVASNEFIKTGFSCNLCLKIDDKSRAIVHFRSTPGQESGVILEYL